MSAKPSVPTRRGVRQWMPTPMPPFDPTSYLIGTMLPRLEAVEAQIKAWKSAIDDAKTAATTYGKRVAIIALVYVLAYLVNIIPGTTVANYAEALRLALIQH